MIVSRSEKKIKTRRDLLAAAQACFARDGLSAARTEDIAVSAGVSHGTVFLHFPTRDELATTAIEDMGFRVAGKIHELAEKGKGVRELLEAHIEGLAAFEPFYARLVMEEAALPPRAANTLVAIQSAISFHLMHAVEREQASGSVRKMPFHLFFNTWIGLLHYYIAHGASFAPGGSVLEKHGKELVGHYIGLVSRN